MRFFCLALTFLVICFIVIRFFAKHTCEDIKFCIGIREKAPRLKLSFEMLTVEIVLHLIQPLPYVDFYWTMIVIGNLITYSIDMFLFSFGVFRLYILLKILKFWFPYTIDKSKRILSITYLASSFRIRIPTFIFIRRQLKPTAF